MATNLKKVVAQYSATHKLEATVNKLVNRLVLERPDDPYGLLAQLFQAESKAPRGVLRAQLDIVLDDDGRSVFQLAVFMNSGVYYGQQACGLPATTPTVDLPTGGAEAAVEQKKDDGEAAVQTPLVLAHVPGDLGQEVDAMVQVVRKNLLPKLVGKEPTDQAKWDAIITAACQDVPVLSPESEAAKRALTRACSIAVCKAGAALRGVPLYRYVAATAGRPDDVFVPVPAISVITGGAFTKAEGNRAPMNEVYALPVGASSYREALSLGRRVHARVQEILAAREGAVIGNSRGSFDANFEGLEECLVIVHRAITTSGCGDRVKIGLAMSASRLFTMPNAVELEGFPEDDIPGTYDLGTDEGRLTSVQLTQQYNTLMLTCVRACVPCVRACHSRG
jgi:enolase